MNTEIGKKISKNYLDNFLTLDMHSNMLLLFMSLNQHYEIMLDIATIRQDNIEERMQQNE